MSQLDFGLIGNCQISALIDRAAKVIWCCMPRLDSPSVFGALLDRDQGGDWSIEPVLSAGDSCEIKQRYLSNTNVLATTFILGADCQFEVIDFAPRYRRMDEIYRPPQIIRVIRPICGIPQIIVRCRPRFDYGRSEPRVSQLSSAVRFESSHSGDYTAYLSTDAPVSYVLNAVPFQLRESKHFVFSYGEPFNGAFRFEIDEQLERTMAYWRSWVKHCNIPFEFQNEVIRSALALKLHIFEDTGAIIAATTTSLPEGPEQGRTWDYRYCWLRDAYFVVTALNRLGQFEEMEQFISYLQNICSSEPLGSIQPVYGIDGKKDLIEREMSGMTGFRGYGPVRVGNAAYKMEQYDVYGEMVLAIAPTFFDRRLDRIDLEQVFKNVHQLVVQAIHCFDLPDAGIWEFRGEKKHSVFSKLMNWAAVDRGISIAVQMGRRDLVSEWVPVRERMRNQIEHQGWNEVSGFYSQSYGSNSPDAANLLLGELGFISYRHPRFQRMLDAYEKNLRVGRGVYRYRTPDDFGTPRTTFTVCAFWMADALWGAGRMADARALFSAVISHANHLGLLSEDMDPETGELWGNFPQTYSHVGLINTAMRISQSWCSHDSSGA
jgi:GH15 family glucan-1,4-alpha-glucosidase